MKLTRRLVEGLGAWLQFEAHCNRRGLFSERYLSNPIGQILGAVYGSDVHAEEPHPALAGIWNGPGARPRLDFVAFKSDHVVAAVESKWIGATRPSVRSVLWDLVRLALVAQHCDAQSTFLLGGRKRDLQRFFGTTAFLGETIGYSKPLMPMSTASTVYALCCRAPLFVPVFS